MQPIRQDDVILLPVPELDCMRSHSSPWLSYKR
jgi:hypothetical protein